MADPTEEKQEMSWGRMLAIIIALILAFISLKIGREAAAAEMPFPQSFDLVHEALKDGVLIPFKVPRNKDGLYKIPKTITEWWDCAQKPIPIHSGGTTVYQLGGTYAFFPIFFSSLDAFRAYLEAWNESKRKESQLTIAKYWEE